MRIWMEFADTKGLNDNYIKHFIERKCLMMCWKGVYGIPNNSMKEPTKKRKLYKFEMNCAQSDFKERNVWAVLDITLAKHQQPMHTLAHACKPSAMEGKNTHVFLRLPFHEEVACNVGLCVIYIHNDTTYDGCFVCQSQTGNTCSTRFCDSWRHSGC